MALVVLYNANGFSVANLHSMTVGMACPFTNSVFLPSAANMANLGKGLVVVSLY